jgi:hypothetical protein
MKTTFAYRVSAFNRRRKWKLFLRYIQPRPADRILDVGFSDREYSSTDNFLEKHYPYPGNITALGVDDPVEFPSDTRRYASFSTTDAPSHSAMTSLMLRGPTP